MIYSHKAGLTAILQKVSCTDTVYLQGASMTASWLIDPDTLEM